MSRSFVTVIPSFLLRGIDPLEVAERYKKGEFSSLRRIPTVEKIIVNVVPVTFAPVNTESTDEPVYVFKDKNGYNRIIVFSNQEEYTAYVNNVPIKRCCLLCGKEFYSDDPERIPLFLEDRYLTGINPGQMTRVTLAWSEGQYCCPDHCYTAIRRYNNLAYRYRESLYRESESIYKNICAEKYPNLTLEEVDLRLLKRFGGSVYDEDNINNAVSTSEKKKKYEYNRIPTFIVVPVKIGYERLNKTE